MNAPDTALQGRDMTITGCLCVAFELGEKSWKLSLRNGVLAPTRCTVTSGDTAAVLTAIAKAKPAAICPAAPRCAAATRRAVTVSGCTAGWPHMKSPT